MRILIFLFLPIFIIADFSLIYRIDNKIIQKTLYKDNNNSITEFIIGDKVLQKMVILNNHKYLQTNKNGKNIIYDLGKKSNNIEFNSSKKMSFDIVKKEENGGYDFKTQKWIIKKDGNIESLIVSNDKKIYSKVKKMILAQKEFLSKDKRAIADIFDLGGGYALIKSNNIELLSHDNKNINLENYISDIIKNNKKRVYSSLKMCSLRICCNKSSKIMPSKELKDYLKDSDWNIINVAKCEDNNVERAILTKDDKYIVVELKDRNSNFGKIDELRSRGLDIKDSIQKSISGYNAKYTYLNDINYSLEDIILPNKILSVYSSDDVDFDSFNTKVLELKAPNNYTLSD